MQHKRSSLRFLLTAYTIGTLGAWVFLIQPLFLGALAEAFQLDPQQIGYLAAIEMAGAALASVLAPFWVNRLKWGHVVAFGLCAASLGNFMSGYAPDFGMLLFARFCTSFFGSGVVYVMGVMMLSETADPDRHFGIAITLQVVFAAIALALLPLLLSFGGAVLMLMSLGGLYFLALPLVRWVPEKSTKQEAKGVSSTNLLSSLNRGVVLTLLSFLFIQVGSGAYWAFIERIGNSAQLSAVAIGNYLGVATIIGALGGATAAVLGVRFGRVIPVTAAFVGYAAGLVCINLPITGLTFLASASLFNYSWNLMIPYQFGSLAHFDTTGRFMVMVPAVQAGGIAVGPLLAGHFISDAGFVHASYTSSVMLMLTMLMLLPIIPRVGSAAKRAGQSPQ